MPNQAEYIVLILQPWLLGFVKLSIVSFYRRVFVVSNRGWFSIFTAAFMVLTGAWAVTFFFAFTLACGTHVGAAWGTYDEFRAYCVNTILLDEIYTIVDFVLDLVVLLMPLPLVQIQRCPRFVMSFPNAYVLDMETQDVGYAPTRRDIYPSHWSSVRIPP